MLVYIPICPVYHYCSYWTYMFVNVSIPCKKQGGTHITCGCRPVITLSCALSVA